MTGLEIALGIAGTLVTMLTLAGMFLLAPRGQLPVGDGDADPQGEQLSRAPRGARD